LDPDWYKGWHIWALANFEVITHLELQKTVLAADAFNIYIKPAVQGESCLLVLCRTISA
jgi:FKBP12-rapamycin complex-associated protein